jgi:hypothetical protein
MTQNSIALFAAATVAAVFSAAAGATTDVGVSVQISQPGVYGRVDIGNLPPPVLVYPQPIVVRRPQVVVAQPVQPVYLWVPPGHQKNWKRHCGRYNACGVPVYFVKDDWYHAHVMPQRGDGSGHGQGKGHGHGKGGKD